MKGRGMNILKPIIICLVLVALEPITLYAQENTTKGQAGYLSIHDKTKGLKLGGKAQVRPLQAAMVYGAHTDAGTRGQATKTHEKMILVSKGYETSFIDLRD